MHKHQVYQIYYDKRTRQNNDPGFIGLNNLQNQRPDWFEYWPIRRFLLSNELRDDCYYAFFSPKFKEKTGLSSQDVHKFLGESEQDIVAFSPFFDQVAFFLNMFDQAAASHGHGVWPCIRASFNQVDPSIDPETLVMTSRQTIFCNYFAARKNVWLEWLTQCEKLFAIAEEGSSELARLLNASVIHSGEPYPAKAFIFERMISFLLATKAKWSVRFFNPLALPVSPAPLAQYTYELLKLDALKLAFRETGFDEYLVAFGTLRNDMVEELSSRLTE